jgi:hypothetical protein
LLNWIEQSSRDLQVGVRSLAKTPAFTVLAVSSLALGIMTTTAIYSVLYAVVLDPFPYKNVDDLTSVLVRDPAQRGTRLSYSVDQFVEISERSRVFDGVIASTISDVVWTGEGDPQRLRGNHGTFNTFDVMGGLRRCWDERRLPATLSLAPSRSRCSVINSGSVSSAPIRPWWDAASD